MHTRFLQGDVRQNYEKQIMVMNILKTDNYISEKLEIKPMTATALNKIGGRNYSVIAWCDDDAGFDEINFDGTCLVLNEFISNLQKVANKLNAQVILSVPEVGNTNCRYEIIGSDKKEITYGVFAVMNNKDAEKILHDISDTIQGSRITVQ